MESSRRILSVWLPLLPTDRLKRRWKASGRLDKRPLVVAGKIANALRLTAVDEKAAALGLHPGKALADARAMLPGIAVIRANEPADAKLLEKIADWCDRYTPFVALDPPHGLFLDVTGAAHLFGGEAAMLKEVARAIAAQGFSVRTALAGTAESARALAQYKNGAIVPPGHEAAAVAELPTEALMAGEAIIHALKRAGLKTVGQVAERKRYELTGRFGSAFLSLLDRTLGRNGNPIAPRARLPDLMAERRFAEPVVTQATIEETIRSLGESLAGVLQSRGAGARVLEAAFFRADGQVRRVVVETGQAARDPAIMTRLFREKLDALADPLDPGFGYDLIRLSATFAETARSDAVDLDTSTHDADIALLIDRLAARFGSHRVMRFLPQDTHIPEAAAVAAPAQYTEPAKSPWPFARASGDAPRRPLRLFARPEPIAVPAVAAADSAPPKFIWRHAPHIVARAEGPERIAMEWWRHQTDMPTRDYFRVEDDQGRRFWLYRDGIPREIAHARWYMHGLFA